VGFGRPTWKAGSVWRGRYQAALQALRGQGFQKIPLRNPPHTHSHPNDQGDCREQKITYLVKANPE
jgi:hypothetical protein